MRTCAAALVLLAASPPALAELGGPVASVEADRGRMGARLTTQPVGRYARHRLTRANGGLVHEYTNAQGQVFAVTWSGPGKPDLRDLLGRYFATFQAAGAAAGGWGRSQHALRRPPQVDRPDLKIQTEGHMGWFRGVALVPSLAPADFSTGDLGREP